LGCVVEERVVVAEVARVPDTDELWRLTMEHSPVGMAIVSPAGDVITANVALCDMLGYDPEVMATLTFHDITHPDDLAADLRLVDQALAGEISSYRITRRYICADGRTVIGDLSVALLRDAQGAPLHFISQIADLTERQAFVERLDAAEAAAEAERRRAQAVFEGVSVGLLQIDADGRYLAFNNRLRELLALAFPDGHEAVAGQSGFAYDVDHRPLEPDEMPSARAARGEQFNDVRLWVGADPASQRALSVSARSVLDGAGAFAGAVLAYHDVTDLVRAMDVKDEFVATVSHELRTPLTSALAYLELLDDSTDVSDDGRQQVMAARRNMLRLSHLVADLIFTTRASAGSALVDPYRVDVATLLAEAVAAASLDAESASVRIEGRRPPSLVAVADGMRLRQVFDNLLDNAIGYSRPGGVVTVDLAEVDGGLELVVADEGVGIEPGDLDEVFGRFFRGANARLQNVPGTGLGLTIVRTIVEAHGGHVTLESDPGRGTTVRVSIPR
jgi:two-component system phosphate regulon sensor histidine kinase PhoR